MSEISDGVREAARQIDRSYRDGYGEPDLAASIIQQAVASVGAELASVRKSRDGWLKDFDTCAKAKEAAERQRDEACAELERARQDKAELLAALHKAAWFQTRDDMQEVANEMQLKHGNRSTEGEG